MAFLFERIIVLTQIPHKTDADSLFGFVKMPIVIFNHWF